MVFLAATADFFVRFWHQIIIIILSCIPLIESRYAIVVGMAAFKDMDTVELFILTQLGALFVGLVLLLLLKPVFKWMKSTRLFKSLVERLESLGKKKGEKLEGKIRDSKSEKAKIWASVVGVYIFVAIPLPGTGVWTGALVATLLDIRFKYALPALILGSITATLVMLAFSNIFLNAPEWLGVIQSWIS